MTDIFGSIGPEFRQRGLTTIPVDGKAAIPTGWPGWLGSPPSEQNWAEWIERCRAKNVGLLTGQEATSDFLLDALDVDEDRLLKMVLHFLGLNRAERRAVLSGKRGKKGATIFVRAKKSVKSTTIKGGGGLGNIDFLAAGKMTVMPPSIHPETGKRYEVYGKSLLEVDLADLPEITEQQIKLLKTAIGSEYAIVIISGKSTHDAGVAFTAVLVRAGATDDEITDIFTGLLPDGYHGDTLKELPGWIKSARDKGFEAETEQSNSLTAALVTLALNSPMVLFNDGDGTAFASLPHLGQSVAIRVGSSPFSLWLRHLAHKALERPVSGGPLREAASTLEAIALFDREAQPVHARIAGNRKGVLIDLGTPDGSLVDIDPNGWQVGQRASHKFVRGAGFEALPIPQRGGDLLALQVFLALDDHNYRLLIAFLINALNPEGPYFILLVEGEQGSGKSFVCEIIKRIVDPNKAMRLRLPDKPQDLMIQAKEYRLLIFDNASGMKAEMSDALCALATGAGIAVRKLYSDGDLYVMSYCRPFAVNGISGYANRPDLMERAIPIKLSPMSERGRRTEAELLAEFDKLLPGILGALYDAVSYAIRNYDTVDPPRNLRMADAARWIAAAEVGLDEKPGAVIEAIAQAQHEFVVERVQDDPLFMKLRALTRRAPFEGYIGDLFAELVDNQNRAFEKGLPQTPSNLSNQLARMKPAMAKAGVTVEFLGKDRRGKKIRISSAPDDSGPPKF
ncbi:bifunctional DNA primase/polymerase [Mesorhizobium sp. M8A.F.Ca.ET.173.01.1.1]|nr:bifunctional DNA primase/polymerase [Mesorhizobium sp. M8A.F.Ca.ET.173.01.1.1]